MKLGGHYEVFTFRSLGFSNRNFVQIYSNEQAFMYYSYHLKNFKIFLEKYIIIKNTY